MACRGQKIKPSVSEIMSRLARSEKLAKDTLNRAKQHAMILINKSWHEMAAESAETDDIIDEVALTQLEAEEEEEDSSSSRTKSQNQYSAKQRIDPNLYQSIDPNVHQSVDPNVYVTKPMDMFAYHMNRISFQCECYLASLPSSAMTKADKLHCQRFHKARYRKMKEKRKS